MSVCWYICLFSCLSIDTRSTPDDGHACTSSCTVDIPLQFPRNHCVIHVSHTKLKTLFHEPQLNRSRLLIYTYCDSDTIFIPIETWFPFLTLRHHLCQLKEATGQSESESIGPWRRNYGWSVDEWLTGNGLIELTVQLLNNSPLRH